MLLASLYSAPTTGFKPTVFDRRIKRKNESKRRRIQWLQKMYFGNCDHDFQSDNTLLQDAIENLALSAEAVHAQQADPLAKIEDTMDREVDDADVQALIEWTNCLDYEEYNNYWSHLGTAGFPTIDILGERRMQQPQRGQVVHSGGESRGTGATQSQGGDDFWTLDELEAV